MAKPFRLLRDRMSPGAQKKSGEKTREILREILQTRRIGQMTHYEIIIYWSREDEAFIAEVPELPGCMADGKTCQEALSNAETVIQEWIETAAELGRPVPEPGRKRRIGLDMPDDLLSSVAAEAGRREKSVSEWIIDMCRKKVTA